MRVIDLGAGSGLLAEGAVDRGADVVALDIDPSLLARGAGRAGRLVVGDARRLPFAGDAFQRAVVRSMLVWMEDRAAAAREVCRVLAPSGVFAGSESLNAEIEIEVAHEGLREIWAAIKEGLASLAPVTLSSADLERLLRDAGFVDVELEVERTRHPDWDPSEFFFEQRGPSGYSLAEYMVSGGIDERLMAGFVRGLAAEGAVLTTSEGIFFARKPYGVALIMA